jgi:hypothetical protein
MLPSVVAMASLGLAGFNFVYLREPLINSIIEVALAVCFTAVQILVIRKTAWRVDISSDGIAGFYFPRRRVDIRWEEIGELREEFSVAPLFRSNKPTLVVTNSDGTREIGISRHIYHYDELSLLIREKLRHG